MYRNLNPAELTGGVPNAPVASGEPVGTTPAAQQPPVQAQPQAPEWQKPFEDLNGKINTLVQMVQQGMQPPAQAVPQAPVVAQPSFRERLKTLGDPVASENPTTWLDGLGEIMEAEIQNRLGGFQDQLKPQLKSIEQIVQEREVAQQQAQFISAFKTAAPEFAGVPDQVIAQRVQAFNTDPSLFMRALAADLAGLVKPQTPQPTIPQPQTPAPGPAATIPNGTPNQNVAQMQADYLAWEGNPMAAQNAKLSRPDYFSQVHAAAVANQWKR